MAKSPTKAWITWGDRVDTYDSKEEALSWKYFLYAESDGPGYVDKIEGPDGQIVSEEEWQAYYDARDDQESKADKQRKIEHPLVGKVQILMPGGNPAKDWNWKTAAWIYGGYEDTQYFTDKDAELADWTQRLGADRVRWKLPDKHGW